jgi:hypothetical protein
MVDLKSAINYSPINSRSKYWMTVLYAAVGKRKTTTACRLVKERGILVAADNSWSVLLKEIHEDLRNKVELVEYDSASQLLHIDFDRADTVILDTFDGMVDQYLDLLLQHAKWPKDGYREQLVTNHPELMGVTNRAQVDYGMVRDKFSPIIETLVKKPVHLVVVCHVNEPSPTATDKSRRPRLPNATWLEVSRPADIVGYIQGEVKKGFTISVDEGSPFYAAKSRMDGLSGKVSLDEFVRVYHDRTN